MSDLRKFIQIYTFRKSITTIFIIALTTIVYLLTVDASENGIGGILSGPDFLTLVRSGAKVNGLIEQGDFIRLFIPILLHGNLFHLTINMSILFYLGPLLEMMVGRKWFLWIYVISGICGNLASFAFIDQISMGASGSIFGVVFAIYLLQKTQSTFLNISNTQTKQFEQFIIANVILNLVLAFTFPMIDWAGHLGGALAGGLIGLSLSLKQKAILFKMFRVDAPKSISPNIPLFGLIAVSIFFLAFGFYRNLADIDYGSALKEVAFHHPTEISNEELLTYKTKIESYHHNQGSTLLDVGKEWMTEGSYLGAYQVFDLGLAMIEQGIMNITPFKDEFSQLKEKASLQKNVSYSESSSSSKVDEVMKEGGLYFLSLGAYKISSLYFKALVFKNPKNSEYVKLCFEAMILGKDFNSISALKFFLKEKH